MVGLLTIFVVLAERPGRSSVAAMGSAAGHFCKTNKKAGDHLLFAV